MGRHGPDDEDDIGAERPKVVNRSSNLNEPGKRQSNGLEMATPEGNVVASDTGGSGGARPSSSAGASPLRHRRLRPKQTDDGEESLAFSENSQYDSQVPGAIAVPGVRAPPTHAEGDEEDNLACGYSTASQIHEDANHSSNAPIAAHLAPTEEDMADRVTTRVQQQMEAQILQQEREEQQQIGQEIGQVAQAVKSSVKETTTSTDDNKDTFYYGISFKCFLLVGAVAFLGIIGIAAGVVIAVLGGPEETKVPTESPTASPTPLPATIAPTTLAPSTLPTTTAPVAEVFSPRFEQALERFGPLLAVDDMSILQDTSTVQHWALRWIADEDPTKLDFNLFPANLFIDRYVMVLFYNVTAGDSWLNQYRFLSSRPTCEWSTTITDDASNVGGVFCFDQTTIGAIVLRGNALQGTIPTEVGLLTSLELLDLRDNFMRGTFPIFLADIPHLLSLWLTTNAFGGTLPSEISNFENLTVLELAENGFSGTIPTEIGLLPKIESIFVSSNLLYGTVPTELGLLSDSLNALLVDQCQLTGTIPTELGHLTRMESLFLGRNELVGQIPSELGELTATTTLFLHQNNLSGQVPSELGRLSLLSRFYFWDNARITGRIPPEFAELTSLIEFAVHSTSLSGGIEETMCDVERLAPFDFLFADCLGTSPEIQCSCCTVCCEDGICIPT